MTSIKQVAEAKSYDGSGLRIGIVHARWNPTIITALLQGAQKTLRDAGVKEENIVVQSVPGSYELPLAAQRMYLASQQSSAVAGGGLVSAGQDLLGASVMDLTSLPKGGETKKGGPRTTGTGGSTQPFDAVIAIGALIKGETMHFEYISDAVSHGLMKVQLETGCPVVFGLLTLLKEDQGKQRAGISAMGHNHGEDWGNAAVELAVKRRGWAEGEFVE